MSLYTLEKTSFEEFNSLTLHDRAKIIELCVEKQYCLTLIGKMMDVSVQTISKVISSYLPKSKPNTINLLITLESKINKS